MSADPRADCHARRTCNPHYTRNLQLDVRNWSAVCIFTLQDPQALDAHERSNVILSPGSNDWRKRSASGAQLVDQLVKPCPLLAQSRHELLNRTCPLSGIKQT